MLRLYAWCLRLYPAAFRARYGAEMSWMVRHEWREARAVGPRAAMAFLLRLLGDLLRTVPHERLAATTARHWLALGTAAGSGLTTGWVQASGGEIPATLVVCAVTAIYFGYFARQRTWRWPAMFVFCFVIVVLLRAAFGAETTPTPLAFILATGAVTLTAGGGAFTGARLRRTFPLRWCGVEASD